MAGKILIFCNKICEVCYRKIWFLQHYYLEDPAKWRNPDLMEVELSGTLSVGLGNRESGIGSRESGVGNREMGIIFVLYKWGMILIV
uniref:Uncharacterized protein n=2 Tax=Moorena producens (strain JHB) TaxID=1454205 RepID=A0A1D9FUF4_MOOP1